MPDIDLLLIAQSEVVRPDDYATLPLERLDLFRSLVFPRMVWFEGRFVSHLDLINLLQHEVTFLQASPAQRRGLLSIWNLPSLGAIQLANALLDHGFRTAIINNFDGDFDRLAAVYRSCSTPPLVGISTTFHLSWSEISRLVRQLRLLDPQMVIVVGGAMVATTAFTSGTVGFERPMRRQAINYALLAQHPEADLCQLIRQHQQGGPLGEVPNLVYLQDAGGITSVHTTSVCWQAPDLATPIHWGQLDLPFIHHTVQLRTSCGCPFSCAFCSYPKMARGLQVADLTALTNTLDALQDLPHVHRLIFVDDNFNVPPDRFKEICRLLSRYRFRWCSFVRVQYLDEDTVRLMQDSGCDAVYLGLESASDSVLANMHKRATSADYRRGIALLKAHGIKAMAAFVLGFPGETTETVNENIAFIESTGLEFYSLKEFYYMHHTPIHEDRGRYGLTGEGAAWQHQTMDSAETFEQKLRMFQTVTGAVHIDPDTSLWYLALLRDHGFTWDTITTLQRYINTAISDQLNNRFDTVHPALEKARSLLKEANSLP